MTNSNKSEKEVDLKSLNLNPKLFHVVVEALDSLNFSEADIVEIFNYNINFELRIATSKICVVSFGTDAERKEAIDRTDGRLYKGVELYLSSYEVLLPNKWPTLSLDQEIPQRENQDLTPPGPADVLIIFGDGVTDYMQRVDHVLQDFGLRTEIKHKDDFLKNVGDELQDELVAELLFVVIVAKEQAAERKLDLHFLGGSKQSYTDITLADACDEMLDYMNESKNDPKIRKRLLEYFLKPMVEALDFDNEDAKYVEQFFDAQIKQKPSNRPDGSHNV